ncbi:MAG: Flp pilus assembly complex ATPase component TadA [Candidatus Niyogibacteria bacterium]|nr:Flp pilus assembly complex ATPase component TadA [Candidatus Niyogibacteria bacterium]
MDDTRFADLLVERGVITADSLNKAKQEASSRGVTLGDILLERGVPEAEILTVKGEIVGVPTKSLGRKKVPFEVLKMIPEESSKHYQFVPIGLVDGVLEIGMLNPQDITAREALNFIAAKVNMPFKIFLIAKSDFDVVVEEYKSLGGEVTKALGELEQMLTEAEKAVPDKTKKELGFIEETPVTKMVAVMLRHAVEGHASDIHIEPQRNQLRVRFRVDGVLHTSLVLPLKVHEAVVSRIKILTNMQLDEKRKPQDGRFGAMIEGREIDFRVSTFPTYFGEKAEIRILDTEEGVKSLEQLGLSGRNLETIKEGLKRPHGLILITGPTGSGKTSTLYSMLKMINQEGVNVVSLEDPVEYNIEGVGQSQVRPEIGYDFASGLRSILRQDPDIIMVGEIRDKETAQLAIHAALTGHLVLSTLHTNSAIGVIPRLIDMGVDPYLIAPTLISAIAQRLVRVLCEDSKKEIAVDGLVKEKLEKEIVGVPISAQEDFKLPPRIYQASPSPQCPKGTSGRVGVFEVINMTPGLEHLVLAKPNELEVLDEARKQGMITMREDGILKVFQGKVGLEELEELV